MKTKPEDMSNDELYFALDSEASKQMLWNYTAQLYAEAAKRIRELSSEDDCSKAEDAALAAASMEE